MADIIISQLPSITPNKTGVIPFSQGGVTYINNISALYSPYHLSFALTNVSLDQTVTANVYSKITFQTIDYNNGFSIANSEVTVPIKGVYAFDSQIVQNTFGNSTSFYNNWVYTRTWILINGVAYNTKGVGPHIAKGNKTLGSNDREWLGGSFSMALDRGDTVSFNVYISHASTGTDSNCNMDNNRAWRGYLIHPLN